jgi:hypothetical protein
VYAALRANHDRCAESIADVLPDIKARLGDAVLEDGTRGWEAEWAAEVDGLLARDAGWGWEGFWGCVRDNLEVSAEPCDPREATRTEWRSSEENRRQAPGSAVGLEPDSRLMDRSGEAESARTSSRSRMLTPAPAHNTRPAAGGRRRRALCENCIGAVQGQPRVATVAWGARSSGAC